MKQFAEMNKQFAGMNKQFAEIHKQFAEPSHCADRVPNPHAWEAKYVQQPVHVAAAAGGIDTCKVDLVLTSRYEFIHVDDVLRAEWIVSEDGHEVRAAAAAIL